MSIILYCCYYYVMLCYACYYIIISQWICSVISVIQQFVTKNQLMDANGNLMFNVQINRSNRKFLSKYR